MSNTEARKIKFNFRPCEKDKGDPCNVTLEKDEGGKKRRYVAGICSGLKTDAHKERMSEKAIKSFMDQMTKQDLLLYPDIHGIKSTEDIGIGTHGEILDNGDWYVEFRIYDENDFPGDIHKDKLATADSVWKQLNGLPPYTKKREKGFSIEGMIPPGGLIDAPVGDEAKSVIDQVELDGVVLVPKPAYESSVASSVYKAIGENLPEKNDRLRKSLKESLMDRVNTEQVRENFWDKRWEYSRALEEMVEKIMSGSSPNKHEDLTVVFEEYSQLMINLVLASEQAFVKDDKDVDESITQKGQPTRESLKSALSDLNKSLSALNTFIQKGQTHESIQKQKSRKVLT